MIRRPPRSTLDRSSAASDVYKRQVLFSVTTATGATRWDQAEIVVQSLRTGARKVVWHGGSDPRYVPTGHLVYAVGNDLFAVQFDVKRLIASGPRVPVPPNEPADNHTRVPVSDSP